MAALKNTHPHARSRSTLGQTLKSHRASPPRGTVRRCICKTLVNENAWLKSVSPLSEGLVHFHEPSSNSDLAVADELQKKSGAPDNGARDNLDQPSNRETDAEQVFRVELGKLSANHDEETGVS